MEMSTNLIGGILSRYAEDGQHYFEWVPEYGEPGYGTERTTMVVIGDYWCRCPKIEGLHSLENHHPRVWAALTAAGLEFEWHDEWYLDNEAGKAWRIEPDSYGWQPSVIWNEDFGDFLTPDHDIETWTEAMANNPRSVLPSVVWSADDLAGAGWTKFNLDTYESGWHSGQNADPAAIMTEVQEAHPESDVVFLLDYTGQFDIGFSAWHRAQS